MLQGYGLRRVLLGDEPRIGDEPRMALGLPARAGGSEEVAEVGGLGLRQLEAGPE